MDEASIESVSTASTMAPSEIDPLLDRSSAGSNSTLIRIGSRRSLASADDDDGASRSSNHSERHSDYGDVVRDTIIGFADGLTVPFALTAGLSSLGDTRLVVMGGLAELCSGAISMGLGAYLAAATEKERYLAEEAREWDEVRRIPAVERQEVFDILADRYHISRAAATPIVDELCKHPAAWVQFMMDFELGLGTCPPGSRAWLSALTMGLSYFFGGLIPMVPYFVMKRAGDALLVSIAITAVVLLAFGYIKTVLTVHSRVAGLWGALQTLVVGALAAGAAYGIVRALDSGSREP